MDDKEFTDWIIEKRLDMLSDGKGLTAQDEVISEIGRILGVPIKPEHMRGLGETLDRIRWDEREIFLKGLRDGARLMKRLNSL